MSSSSKQPSLRRPSKVFVQVPPSPRNLEDYHPLNTSTHSGTRSKLKENTPLQPPSFSMAAQTQSTTSIKRKISDKDLGSPITDGTVASAKKQKTSAKGVPLNTNQANGISTTSEPSLEFPNGWTYCHQCNKKRDLGGVIRCTSVEQLQTNKSKVAHCRQCSYKYCKSCLKNRYSEDFDSLLETKSTFICPKCRDVCNCPKCRKAKGLEPIGFIPKPKQTNSAGPKKEKMKTSKSKDADQVKVKPAKTLPDLRWVSLPHAMSQEDAEERIFIREFMLRFSPVMEPAPAKAHLEELEVIAGRTSYSDGDKEVFGWVSEMSARAIILGCLSLLAGDHEEALSKAIRACIKDLRASGAQLNKMWSCLDTLRRTVADITAENSPDTDRDNLYIPLTFPDPYPAPSIDSQHNTRATRNASSSTFNVAYTFQLLPVVVSLIHSALETAVLREDIDQAIKDSRDWGRNAREALRVESERWEEVKKALDTTSKDKEVKAENRDKRQLHKDRVSRIDNSSRIVAPAYSPRFAPLGTDDDGRIYYALSAGVSEREAAYEFVEAAMSERRVRLKKKCRVPSLEDRAELREWSWFVAVWGKRPEQVARKNSMQVDGEEEGEDEDDGSERWWCFWEQEEIRKLADWVAISGDLEEEHDSSQKSEDNTSPAPSQSSGQARLKSLVVGLRDYASLLEWRTAEHRYGDNQTSTASVGGSASAQGKRAMSPVPPERFYS